jgi:signal transduction histidine kinase
MTLTPEQIARLRQLHWLATKHWSASIGMDALVLRADGSRMVIGDAIYHPEWALDAELIAASRNALPELLDELERLRAEASAGEEYRDILRRERDEARAEVARLQEELKQARTRAIVGEHRNLLERLGKSSMAEATEDTLRTKLAETELRAEQAEQSLAALLEQIATEAPTRKPRHSGVCAPLRAELARERQRINDLIRLMRDCVDFIDRRELTGLSVPDQRAVRNTLLAVLPPAPKET